MASFWDKLKKFFGASPAATLSVADLEDAVRDALKARIKTGAAFSTTDVTRDVSRSPRPTPALIAAMSDALKQLADDGFFQTRGYRAGKNPSTGEWLFAPVKSAPAASAPRGATAATTTASSAGPYRTAADPYTAPGILSLSAEELRKRALKIDPYRTAWIGRTDTIPPQSDDRTAIIDRGLILRGLLTEAQITEIHRVGDLWLAHAETAKLAAGAAKRAASEALEDIQRERAARKAEKKRLAAERSAKHVADVARRRATDIVFLGAGVSGRLADRRANVERLAQLGLPVLATPADVADALGLSVPRLRWLCFHSNAVERSHYVYFQIPKRSGGMRTLAAPHKTLAAAQRWVLANILAKLPTESPAHGFIAGRSTVTNATPHVGRNVVINLDLADFFPTVSFRRVRGVFHRLGYSPAAATVLALLCTESPRQAAEYDGAKYWVAAGDRALPQGACTSPALSNQVTRKLDRRLAGMAQKHGWAYTRYADDLTFSAPAGQREDIGRMLARVKHIVENEGFAINPRKGRVQRASTQQSVTGVVVNDKPGLPREEVRRLRAILHGAKKSGLAAQNRDGREDFEAWLRGKLAYLAMVDAPRGRAMLGELDALLGRGV